MDKLPLAIRRALIETSRTAASTPLPDSKIPLRSLATLDIRTRAAVPPPPPLPPPPKISTATKSHDTPSPPLLRLDTLLLSLATQNPTDSDSSNGAHDDVTTTTTGGADNPKPPPAPWSGGTNVPVRTAVTSPRTAEALLNEVRFRLASQHRTCLDLIEAVSVSSSSSVVRCEREREREEGLRELKNLEILHADTFALTHHLLSNDKPTLTRFSPADRTLLASTFEQIRSRHASTVETLADVVLSLPPSPPHDDDTTTATLVESFLRSRLPIQFLCDHYISLHRSSSSSSKPHGGVSLQCPLIDVVEDAVLEARHVCDDNGGITPEVTVAEDDVNDGGGGVEVDLVRPYVHHALVELLKNAMASSIERWRRDGDGAATPPDVRVEITTDGEEDGYVACDVIDRGVGLEPSHHRHHDGDGGGSAAAAADDDEPFRFTYSSSPRRWDRIDEQRSYAAVRPPLGSLGVGLTSSRMTMQMFGGDVLLWDNDGRRRSGTDGIGGEGCTARLVLKKDADWWTGEYWKR